MFITKADAKKDIPLYTTSIIKYMEDIKVLKTNKKCLFKSVNLIGRFI